ncbi:superoxide dismutase family protein [Azospirillum sp.]|uniref:superoxide dismutase family protein n=1 Tax=Azospirillum sp. TaxID=34012 RepID=UPI002D69E4F7|nr:superoxide dismutase family protein [Azospirillum sp.]HYD70631.1 superoxide dismutase family protein [Azospirillum sp.]
MTRTITACATAAAAAVLLLGIGAASAQTPATAKAAMKDAQGKALGTVTLQQHPHGVVIRGELDNVAPGWHAVHIHAVGKCEPDFAAAGGHFNPTNAKHGMGATEMHAGDLPNFFVDERGHARFEMMTHRVSLTDGPSNVFDADGASLIVHAGVDDYATDPAGNSGNRIACGVIAK